MIGPWRYDERGGMVAVYSGAKRDCLDMPDESFVWVRYWERKHDGEGFVQIDEDRTIGKLIAAAPDMLAALKQVVAERPIGAKPFETLSLNARTIEAIYSAITKAEGRESRQD